MGKIIHAHTCPWQQQTLNRTENSPKELITKLVFEDLKNSYKAMQIGNNEEQAVRFLYKWHRAIFVMFNSDFLNQLFY